MAGLFVSIDGVDGAGKSTQIELLQTWFRERGDTVIVVRDPGGTALGESLREILLHRQEVSLGVTAEMLLYMASRAQLVEEVIRPELATGKTVIADRYLLANVVYQGAAGGLDTGMIWQVGGIATQDLTPRLTIVLDADPEVSLKRLSGDPDRLESRGIEYMRKVRAGFLRESARLGTNAIVVDAAQPIEDVHQQIVTAVTSCTAPSSNQPNGVSRGFFDV